MNGTLTFIIVPDNTKPGAYNEAATDCSYIIHTASPLATAPGDLVSQAISGTKAILEAAEATSSVQRVVFTASTSSLRPFERMFKNHPANLAIMAGHGDEVSPLTADTRVSTQPPRLPDSAPGFQRYINSKIAATNLVDEYAAKSGCERFSIVNLMPGWILGPEELSRSKTVAFRGSNIILGWMFAQLDLAPFLGLPKDEDAPLLSETVHLDDVVEGHVKALDTERVPGYYRSFLLCSDSPSGPVIMDAADVVRKELRREVADGRIPFVGELGRLRFKIMVFSKANVYSVSSGSIKSKFDATPSERDLLGHPFLPFEKQVVDTVKWYVHLED